MGRTGSIVLAVLCSLLAISAGGSATEAHSTYPPPIQALAVAGAFIMIGASVLLVWRHRFPLQVAVLAIAITLIFPTTPLTALIALATVTAVRRGRLRWLLIVAAFLSTVVALVWDVLARTSLLGDFIGEPVAGTSQRLSLLWAVPVIAAAAVAVFAGFGMLRGVRSERDAARLGTAAATRNVAVLHREVERERERQDLARELHDGLAARLSSLSLHAGALELTADGAEQETARMVRQSAQASLDELRHVVQVLRDPSGTASPPTGLTDIGALVDEALRDGADVRMQLLVTDPGSCDPQVAHACYRIVQECISNVRRHAPGAALRLEVRGTPSTGVTVTAANWLTPDAAPTSMGGGHGLAGMSERVAIVGGSFQAGPTPEGTFTVIAWLPWNAAREAVRGRR